MKIDLYEKIIIGLAIVMMVVFAGALATAALALGIHVPGEAGRIDPNQINTTPPFDQPGLRELGPGRYEAVIVAQMWAFNPSQIRVPAGSTVTFKVASRDVIHGLNIERTNANIMLVPGQISQVTVTFDRPGQHLLICHEYCGIAHHAMYGLVIVE